MGILKRKKSENLLKDSGKLPKLGKEINTQVHESETSGYLNAIRPTP